MTTKTLEKTIDCIPDSLLDPHFLVSYVGLRRYLRYLETEKAELEGQLVDYANTLAMEGNLHKQRIPSTLEGVELYLVGRSPTDKTIVASDPDLKQMAEQLEDDRATTRERNADKINQLIQAMEEMQEEIESLSYSEGGHELKAEFDTHLESCKRIAGKTYSIRLVDKVDLKEIKFERFS